MDFILVICLLSVVITICIWCALIYIYKFLVGIVDCIYNIQQPHHTQSDPDDVIEHEKMNSFLCSCDKCFHWEKYKECKICNAENICSNEEEMDKNDKDKPTYYSEQLPTRWELFKNNSEAGENKNNKEEQKLLNEIVLQMQKNKQDSNCSETLHYCAHCDYATKRKFNMERHMKITHTHTQEDLDLLNYKLY